MLGRAGGLLLALRDIIVRVWGGAGTDTILRANDKGAEQVQDPGLWEQRQDEFS